MFFVKKCYNRYSIEVCLLGFCHIFKCITKTSSKNTKNYHSKNPNNTFCYFTQNLLKSHNNVSVNLFLRLLSLL